MQYELDYDPSATIANSMAATYLEDVDACGCISQDAAEDLGFLLGSIAPEYRAKAFILFKTALALNGIEFDNKAAQ
jgi:hypothetical protein